MKLAVVYEMMGRGVMRGARQNRTHVARRLRRNSTDAESRLWQRLRSRGINGLKFVRQEPIGPFVVDFVCREKRLIIEVDGGQHATNERDVKRDRWLNERHFRVLRFWNNDVHGNIDGVLETIAVALNAETPPHPEFVDDVHEFRPLPASGER